MYEPMSLISRATGGGSVSKSKYAETGSETSTEWGWSKSTTTTFGATVGFEAGFKGIVGASVELSFEHSRESGTHRSQSYTSIATEGDALEQVFPLAPKQHIQLWQRVAIVKVEYNCATWTKAQFDAEMNRVYGPPPTYASAGGALSKAYAFSQPALNERPAVKYDFDNFRRLERRVPLRFPQTTVHGSYWGGETTTAAMVNPVTPNPVTPLPVTPLPVTPLPVTPQPILGPKPTYRSGFFGVRAQSGNPVTCRKTPTNAGVVVGTLPPGTVVKHKAYTADRKWMWIETTDGNALNAWIPTMHT